MTQSIALEISDSSHIGEARRAVTQLAAQQGFDETDRGRAALVVTELAANIIHHAGEGQILLRPLTDSEGFAVPTLEVLTIDKGSGMASVGRAMQDGYSTAGTKGEGMGAVRRQSTQFDLYSMPGQGTAILARIAARQSSDPEPENVRAALVPDTMAIEVGAVCVAVRGENVCGDAWAVRQAPEAVSVLVADGLGHGPNAATASQCAVEILRQENGRGPVPILEAMHAALRSTRGAACAVAQLEIARAELRYAGAGNIVGNLVTGETTRHLVSRNGTVGQNLPRLQEDVFSWPNTATLILHSDGLATHWSLDNYPGLLRRHASLIAAVLYRDFRRVRDDATVLVVRLPQTAL